MYTNFVQQNIEVPSQMFVYIIHTEITRVSPQI